MNARKNVPFGVHELGLIHVQISGMRVSFIFAHASNEFIEVIRTFTLGTSQLASFMETFYRAPKDNWSEDDFKNLVGKVVRAEIRSARNPNYVNLHQIIKVLSAGEVESFIFKPVKPVSDSESGSHLRQEERESDA